MTKQIKTLQEFYTLMQSSVLPKKYLVDQILTNATPYDKYIDELKATLDQLNGLPKQNGKSIALLTDDKEVRLDLTYEISELHKDLFFLNNSKSKFYQHLSDNNPNFTSEKNLVVDGLQGHNFRNFITDRDGTINNYCGRYASSIQSIYNAVFLTNFRKKCIKNAVILTAAPLTNMGLADISITAKEDFILAGSKGREYINNKGKLCRQTIHRDKQKKLAKLNDHLTNLISKPKYKKFTFIGSGIQFKFGETTIARQDITQSIPDIESANFLREITAIVSSIDKAKKYFHLEDTGTDIEIILTINEEHDVIRNFDKSDGIQFLNKDAKLKMNAGPTLLCGDTAADALMIPITKNLHKNSRTIFVTKDKSLEENIEKLSPEAIFVSSPDTLVAALNEIATGLLF